MLCIKEKYSKRELERQIDSCYYERYMLSQKPTTPAIAKAKKNTGNIFLDTYTLDFLNLPEAAAKRTCKNPSFTT
jgi:predicted nuclease of restriction endonuclease-like (RecB) superfamily